MSDYTLFDEAGWFEGRQVDITDDLSALRGDGYPVWPELEAVLSEFSGLDVMKGRATVELGAVEAVDCTEREDTAAYERFGGQALAPVGYYSGETIYLGVDGRYYGGYADLFGLLRGSDLKEVVETMLLRLPALPFEPVPEMQE